MKTYWFMSFFLMAMLSPAKADVIKCKTASGKIVYQESPCPPTTVSQQRIDIKQMDQQQLEESKRKLKDWQEAEAIKESEKMREARDKKAEQDRLDVINALNRNAAAQEQQAIAAQRQAENLERRNNSTIYNGPYLYGQPYYSSQSYNQPYQSDHNHQHHGRFPVTTNPNNPRSLPNPARPFYPRALRPDYGRDLRDRH